MLCRVEPFNTWLGAQVLIIIFKQLGLVDGHGSRQHFFRFLWVSELLLQLDEVEVVVADFKIVNLNFCSLVEVGLVVVVFLPALLTALLPKDVLHLLKFLLTSLILLGLIHELGFVAVDLLEHQVLLHGV